MSYGNYRKTRVHHAQLQNLALVRYVRQLRIKFQSTDMIPVPHKAGCSKKTITQDRVTTA